MANILIVYGSTDGHTAKVAETIASTLNAAGHETAVHRGDRLPGGLDPAHFDGVIIGGSVHYNKFQDYLAAFIEKNLSVLNRKPSAFFAVSGASSSGEKGRREAKVFSDPFLRRLGWVPHNVEQIAGAFPFTRYSWWKRLMLGMIVRRGGGEGDTSKDYVYTDWERVQRFAADFAAALPTAS